MRSAIGTRGVAIALSSACAPAALSPYLTPPKCQEQKQGARTPASPPRETVPGLQEGARGGALARTATLALQRKPEPRRLEVQGGRRPAAGRGALAQAGPPQAPPA